ncbi:MAG: type II toxin-antitoxin system RelE/ParE family toxin [Chitinophagaceae bacterium]
MAYKIELHPEAIKEMKESYLWYEQRSENLGKRFISAVDKRLDEIADHPERYSKRKVNYREARTEIFPYIIIYEILEKEKIVFVSYIFHARRNPKLKYKRK